MQRYELEAWLGPALTDMTTEQVDTLEAVQSAYISLTDGQGERDHERDAAVLSAALQHILGELDLDALGTAAVEADLARRWAILGAVLAGMSEAQAARDARVDRMTVRRMLGKR